MKNVTQDAVRAELARILASPEFARAERLSALLRFIVEEAAEGRTDSIKETVIGVEVFGRPAVYDPRADSTVRIQAARLREKLRAYYLNTGREDELIIELPKGSYVPLWRPAPQAAQRRVWWRLAVAGVALGVVAAGGTLGWRLGTQRPLTSIAVLPLHNLGGEADNELLADGLSEDLIRQLAGLPDVRVVSHTSSFAMKGKGKSLREIGVLLDVEGVVEGTLQRVGNRVKITAQLVRAADDRTLWSGAFEREFSDLFRIEDELSSAIVHALHANLTRQRPAQKGNPEAYALYLRGLYAARRGTLDAARDAVRLFEQATEKDPLLARAWSAQAFARWRLGVRTHMPGREVAPKAKAAALRALEIDNRLAEGHAALGLVLFLFEGNRQGAEESFRRALRLGPNSCEAWMEYAQYLVDVGPQDEALEAARRAERLDPLAPWAGRLVGAVLYYAHRYDEAIAQSRKVIERNPEIKDPYWELGGAYLLKGMCGEALDAFRQQGSMGRQAVALARCGRQQEALEILTRLKKVADAGRRESADKVAQLYTALGDHPGALDYLERASREHEYQVRLRDPLWDPLRGEPRFIALRKRMGLD